MQCKLCSRQMRHNLLTFWHADLQGCASQFRLRWDRWAFQCVTVLVMSIGLTVLVAWISALLVPVEHIVRETKTMRSDSEAHIWVLRLRGVGADRVCITPRTRGDLSGLADADPIPIPKWLARSQLEEIVEGDAAGVLVDAHGWPFRCLMCLIRYQNRSDSWSTALTDWGISLGARSTAEFDPKSGGLALPLRPIWLGLAGNVLVYALIVILFTTLIRTLRKHFGPRSGCCPVCGYDLRFVRGCPECGWHR